METVLYLLLITFVLAMHLTLAFMAMGAFFLAFICEVRAFVQGKVLYRKLAQQISHMGLWGMFYLFLLYTAFTVAVLQGYIPDVAQPWLAHSRLVLYMSIFLCIVFILNVFYATTFKLARTKPSLHLLTGFTAIIFFFLLSFTGIALKTLFYSAGLSSAFSAEEILLQVLGMPRVFYLLALYIVFCLLAATGCGTFFLILRRKKDDFGRDYYNFAVKQLARQNIFWACVLAIIFSMSFFLPQIKILSGINLLLAYSGFAVLLIPVICSISIIMSKTPLRLKPVMLLGTLFQALTIGIFSLPSLAFILPGLYNTLSVAFENFY